MESTKWRLPNIRVADRPEGSFWELGEAEGMHKSCKAVDRLEQEMGKQSESGWFFDGRSNLSDYQAWLFLSRLQSLCLICGLSRALAKGDMTNQLL